jgi:Lipase (class 3)
MAERVWDVSGHRLTSELDKYPEYDLILTGHSLGAGAACLLNIKLHENERSLINGRRVRCFAYASPPVFSPLSAIPEAMNACTNYIHERDVVPFLSMDSLRHWLASVKAIQDYTDKMNILDRWSLATGIKDIEKEVKEIINRGRHERLPSLEGAPLLSVPAATNVWMLRTSEMDYDFCLCDPEKLSTLGLVLDPTMVIDHVPLTYERALDELTDAFEDI